MNQADGKHPSLSYFSQRIFRVISSLQNWEGASGWVATLYVISGWWLGHPSEKYESQLGWLFPIYAKIKNGNQTTNQSYIFWFSFCIQSLGNLESSPFTLHRVVAKSCTTKMMVETCWNPIDHGMFTTSFSCGEKRISPCHPPHGGFLKNGGTPGTPINSINHPL